MSRINTNVQSLIAQRVLSQNHDSLSVSLERLSTGLKINSGKDDPAGLIASQNLDSELKSINAAVDNANRADQVVNIAEGGLQEVSGLLTDLQGLVTSSANTAGLSDSEKSANQLQIDSILQTIDRVSSATSFQGTKLLNGNFDYKVSNVAQGVTDYHVNGAKFVGGSLNVNVLVTQSAQQGGLYLSMGGTALDLNGAGTAGPTSSFTVDIAGALGSRELTFSSGTSLSDVAAAVNSFQSITGVQATVVASGGSNGLKLTSTDFGSSSFVRATVTHDGGAVGDGIYNFQTQNFNAIDVTGGAQAFNSTVAAQGIRDAGQDIGATINGYVATSNGKTARINTDSLDIEMTFDNSTATTLGSVGSGTALKLTGGGADFQLAGRVDIEGKVSLGIGDVSVRKLGDSDLGFLSSLASGKANSIVKSDGSTAQQIVDHAIEQVSTLRGRLGAFQKNTIGATIRSLNVSAENTAAAESTIRDADFAAETASLTRSQILVSASTQVLGLANAAPQSVLQLLG
jgi:flagellin